VSLLDAMMDDPVGQQIDPPLPEEVDGEEEY